MLMYYAMGHQVGRWAQWPKGVLRLDIPGVRTPETLAVYTLKQEAKEACAAADEVEAEAEQKRADLLDEQVKAGRVTLSHESGLAEEAVAQKEAEAAQKRRHADELQEQVKVLRRGSQPGITS